ncbi:TOBE domain-containing protein [Desulfatiferula olefinivorans]
MTMKKKKRRAGRPDGTIGQNTTIKPVDEGPQALDTVQLTLLEKAFRDWALESSRKDVRHARMRILLVFLLIRNTGAKLNEMLGMNPFTDIDTAGHTLTLPGSRTVPLSDSLCDELRSVLSDAAFRDQISGGFNVDPAFVRRKFYERAEACGFHKQMGGPEMIRKARAVELLRGNMPLPAVQALLGHVRPNQASSYVQFSPDEIREATRLYMQREASRKTSARNAFFCKINRIVTGDIQARVDLMTVEGQSLSTVITTDSLAALGLARGSLVTAEVKAPWIDLYAGEDEPRTSAENRLQGTVTSIKTGAVNTEYRIDVSERTALCAIVSSEANDRLKLSEGDRVWALFNGFAVILHQD